MSDASKMADSPTMDRPLAVHRWVQIGLFVSLVWKWAFFLDADKVYQDIPIDDVFFPGFFSAHPTLRIAYLGSLAAICANFFFVRYGVRLLCSIVTMLSLTVLCLHQGSYNDATFTTCWWTSLWTLWFVGYMKVEECDADLRRPAFLSRAIISMILLGGAVGKWTSEYWSGEVIYRIYFVDRDFWVFNLLRENFDANTLREIATWYSRKVIVVETICGFGLWLLPPRWAAVIAMFVLTSIAVFSNWLLLSVLSCLISLASVGLFVRQKSCK